MGRPAKISRSDAVRAAIDLIDDDGLEALSVSAVARRLGVTQPTLYHHFENRADLVRAVGEHLLEAGELPEVDPASDWRQVLEDQAVYLRRAVTLHPNATPLLMEVAPRFTVPSIYEQWLSILVANGVPPEQRLLVIEGLESIAAGSGQALATRTRLGVERYPDADDGHPHLAAIADVAAAPGFDDEATFRSIVRAFLSGATAG